MHMHHLILADQQKNDLLLSAAHSKQCEREKEAACDMFILG